MSEAIQAGDYGQGCGDLVSGHDRVKAAASFRKNPTIGGDCWPLHEYAKVDNGDLDRMEEQVHCAYAIPAQCDEHDPE